MESMKIKRNMTLNRPDIGLGEYISVLKVLKSGKLAQGELVNLFESQFAKLHKSDYAVACNSGTSALYLILLGMNIGPDDEVLVPAFTFGATANAVLMTGARVVFVDVDLDSYNMSYEDAKNKMSKKVKAIIVVHLYGNPVNLNLFTDLASKSGAFLIQDAAQAHLAMWDGLSIAEYGDALAFSFYPTKNMTTIEGGMVLTNNSELAKKISILRNQGMSSRYAYELPGLNLRMTEISAAVGISQLKRLVKWTTRRIKNATELNSKIQIKSQRVHPSAKCVYHQFTIEVDPRHRELLRQHLKELGIESDIYYPKSLAEYPVFGSHSECPNASSLSQSVISIPVHHKITYSRINFLASAINSFINNKGRIGNL